MDKSNITFKNNVFPITTYTSSDQEYLRNVVDYDRLKFLKNKYFSLAFQSNALSGLQREIVEQGTLCAYAKNDPCWGLYNNKWVCKCVKKNCRLFPSCRKSFDDSEYKRFSPDVVNTDNKYYYWSPDDNEIVYFPVITAEEILYDLSKPISDVQKQVKVVHFDEEPSVNVVKVLRQTEQQLKDALPDVLHPEESKPVQVKIEQPPSPSVLDIPNNIFDTFVAVEQKYIIQADCNENLFVNAGPGTGKTYTLIERINHLVTNLDIEPESIMVVCFTNAAVAEIKSRLRDFVKRGGSRGLRNVDIRTFHSFAWWLIGQANEELTNSGWYPVTMTTMSFDDSIKHAIRIVRTFGEKIFDGWDHFFVDEIQDLTDVRASLVLYMINACLKYGCGITVFGDSCQAIYDYTQRGNDAPLDSEQFYKSLYRQLQTKARFLELQINHRQIDDLINLTAELRKAILENDRTYIVSAAKHLLSDIPSYEKAATKLNDEDFEVLRNGKKVCFMCRTNAQVLNLSSILWQKNIAHTVNAYDSFENYAIWISKVFLDYTDQFIAVEKFTELFNERVGNDDIEAEKVWKRLQDITYFNGDMLNVRDLLKAIRFSKVDDTILRSDKESDIIVSNIHRAKGREYESVVLDKSFVEGLTNAKSFDIGEYKALYVAITRPKHTLLLSELSMYKEISYLYIYDHSRRTGEKRCGKKKNRRLTHIEIIGNLDIDISSFHNNTNQSVQEYIWQNVKVGDEVQLLHDVSSAELRYNVVHCYGDEQTILGCTTQKFSNDLETLIWPYNAPVDVPEAIEKLFVSGVYSHIEQNVDSNAIPFTTWSWVDFCGLGHIIYDTY